ncbi:hypothetical protein K502DRAFT_295832 [Neoconidiobolus thromboides FSU 785]|nr:hypothetical protein K502DRAFT_295832 [Neoconidiobolus thromboides FSU 785]
MDTDFVENSDHEQTIKDRQEILNEYHPFGLPLWKPALYKKSRSITRSARSALHSIPTEALYFSVGNLVWLVLFGWWLSIVFYTLSWILFLVPFGGLEYSKVLSGLAWYIFWPFNKYVEKINPEEISRAEVSGDEEPLLGGTPRQVVPKSGLFPGKFFYFTIYYTIVAPLMLIVSLLCWLMVFSVPMAKLNYVLVKKLRRIPLSLKFNRSCDLKLNQENAHPSLCTTYAFGLGYYKYTHDGINILFINLMMVVFFTLTDAYILAPWTHGKHPLADQSVIFAGCLASTVPLAYFIGMAVSSISAQSSLGMGAVINATFGSIVEIILYCIALTENKAELVEGSIIGSMLAGLLLMPGFSMIGGALKKKQQRFNAKSAGVTSTMLIMSLIGVFTPTLFYSIYANFELRCTDCPVNANNHWSCKSCAYYQPHPSESKFYYDHARPLMYICAIILPLTYLIGLWFALRTHTKLIYAPPSNPSKMLQSIYNKLLPGHILEQLNFSSKKVEPNQNSDNATLHSVNVVECNTQTDPIPDEEPSSSNSPTTKIGPETTAFENLETIPLAMHQSIVDAIHMTHNNNKSYSRDAGIFSDDDEDDDEVGGHDAPEWSKLKSAVILCSCTILFSLIAEVMVGSVDSVIEGVNISEKMLGLTIFALVPNVTEFVNAISFAIHGNIPLSMEIGSAYTVQVALLQIPSLVAFSAYYHWSNKIDPTLQSFTLIFPRLDMFSVLLSVFLITYIYIEGKSNYFKGSVLVLTYVVWLSAFALEPPINAGGGMLASAIPPMQGLVYV